MRGGDERSAAGGNHSEYSQCTPCIMLFSSTSSIKYKFIVICTVKKHVSLYNEVHLVLSVNNMGSTVHTAKTLLCFRIYLSSSRLHNRRF